MSGKRRYGTVGPILFGLLLFIGFFWWRTANSGMRAIEELVRARFPSVTQISTQELASWLSDSARPRPLLLDVRTRAEYDVSHLPGAVRVDPASRAEEILASFGSARPIVVYCSVGYRSSALAQRLIRAGRREVFNLEGSIFAWANENRFLERDGHPTDEVHPYNKTYGKLLAARYRADLPDVEP